MSTHCIEKNHFIDMDSIKLIHSERKAKRLDLLEQLEIKKSLRLNTLTTNDQQNFLNTPIIVKILIFSSRTSGKNPSFIYSAIKHQVV